MRYLCLSLKDLLMTTIFTVVFLSVSVLGVLLYLLHGNNEYHLYIALCGFVALIAICASNFYYYGKLKKMDINEMEDANVKVKKHDSIVYMDDRKG